MTLTAEQSSNKARYEAATTAEIIDIIRIAMGKGCIRPCHVYDAVDELICRIQTLENNPKRNCDVGTAEEQAYRMRLYCNSHGVDESGCFRCEKCPFLTADRCELAWAQMPYEAEEGAKKQ